MTQVLVEQYPSPMKLEVLNVDDWPILQHEAGRFETCEERTETSLIVEGEAEIQVDGEQPVLIREGDLVTILPGTRCSWHITKAIKRHHSLG